jgi:hypothetical protein
MKAVELEMEDVKHLSGMKFLKSLCINLQAGYCRESEVKAKSIIAAHAAGLVPHLETFEYHYVTTYSTHNEECCANNLIDEYKKQYPAKHIKLSNSV